MLQVDLLLQTGCLKCLKRKNDIAVQIKDKVLEGTEILNRGICMIKNKKYFL